MVIWPKNLFFRSRNEMRLPKQFIKSWTTDHGLYIIANNYIYSTSLLANIYIHLSTIVIEWRNYEKHEGEDPVISSLALWLGILCMFSEDGYKMTWTFDWQLSNDKDKIQLLIRRLCPELLKTLDWHLVKQVSVSIKHKGEDLY